MLLHILRDVVAGLAGILREPDDCDRSRVGGRLSQHLADHFRFVHQDLLYRLLGSLLMPDAQKPAKHNNLSDVIGVVVRDEQRLA